MSVALPLALSIAATQTALNESRTEKHPYLVEVNDNYFITLPHVFSPKYFRDTAFFAETITSTEGEDFLEIGPGTGVISVLQARMGARVTAVEINPTAVLNTSLNAQLHHVSIDIHQGSLFSAIDSDRKFNTIFWNVPFAETQTPNTDVLEYAVFDPGYASIGRFIPQAVSHLKPAGRLLIGFSSTLGNLPRLNQLLAESQYKVRLLAETSSVETVPVSFELYEAKQVERNHHD